MRNVISRMFSKTLSGATAFLVKKQEVGSVAKEDEYIAFIIGVAKKQNIPEEYALPFFHQNHDMLRYHFVFHSKKVLLLNDVNKTLKKAALQYK